MINKHDDDLEWLVAQRPDQVAHDPSAHDSALQALRSHIDARGSRAATPRRGRRRPRGWRSAVPIGMSLCTIGAVAAVLIAGSRVHAPSIREAARPGAGAALLHRDGVGRRSLLIRLAADVIKAPAPTGNATLVTRSTTAADGQKTTVYDLYPDGGGYYFAPTESGLPAQVSGHHDQASGMFDREVAAARLAATGNVQQAAQDMADAPDPGHVVPPATVPSAADIAAAQRKLAAISGKSVSVSAARQRAAGTLYDNYVWENSLDAIIAGSGDPQVRAGVLRMLATLPGVTVTQQTTNGVPTLTLTGTAPEVGSDRVEALTINADTGAPIKLVGGLPQGPDGVVMYGVSRVDTAHLPAAAG